MSKCVDTQLLLSKTLRSQNKSTDLCSAHVLAEKIYLYEDEWKSDLGIFLILLDLNQQKIAYKANTLPFELIGWKYSIAIYKHENLKYVPLNEK